MPQLTQAKKRRLRHQAILALISEPTVAAAARKIKVHDNTLEAWMREPEFIQQLTMAQEQAIGHGVIKAQSLFSESLDVIAEIMRDQSVNPSTRIAAVGKLHELVAKVITARTSAAEIQRLENELKRLRNGEIEEEDDDEERQAGTAQRQRQLPAHTGNT